MRTGVHDIFTFYSPTRIVHGLNSSKEAATEFKKIGGTKALIVTDHGVKAAGLLENTLMSFKNSAIPCIVFDEVEEDPGIRTVEKGSELARKEHCDGIVVVGGGSPICAGRGIGVVVTNGGSISDYVGINKASKPPLPLVAIPTTAGSGAEVSQFIILKDEERHTKIAIGSPLYFPKVAILDPILTRGLTFRQSVISGIDALSHAIEAYFTSLTTPITDALALCAVSLIGDHIRRAATSDDMEAKEACLLGSTIANMACGNARLGLAHALTMPMEGMFKIGHGIAVGTILPYVMEYNLAASHQRFASLGHAMGERYTGSSEREAAINAIKAVKRLFMDLDFPRRYADTLVDRKAIPELARMVMGGVYDPYDSKREYSPDEIVPSANIRKATMRDITTIYERSFQGWEL